MGDETVTVDLELLVDLLAHCVTAGRALGLIEGTDPATAAAAETALTSVDHVGRRLAELVGADPALFGGAPVGLRPGTSPPARELVVGPRRDVDALADVLAAMRPRAFGWRELPMLPDVEPALDDFEDDTSGDVITSAPRE